MPISSQSRRRSAAISSNNANTSRQLSKDNEQLVWRPTAALAASRESIHVGADQAGPQFFKRHKAAASKSSSTFQVKRSNKTSAAIKQISAPTACASTSMALNSRLSELSLPEASGHEHYQKPAALKSSSSLSLAGQLILAGKQVESLSGANLTEATSKTSSRLQQDTRPAASLSLLPTSGQLHKLSCKHKDDFYLSRASGLSQASSSAQLQPNQRYNHEDPDDETLAMKSGLSISSRNMNLKYVKTLVIVLMALDLALTILLHQFAAQDHLQIWLTTYKLRFSVLNLVLSAIWFIILVGAILFDIYFILLISSIVNVGSFILLLVLSIVHFYKRIDYNTVQLTSLLALLFSIIFLHVYLLALSGLTIYLTGAVRRRNKSQLSTG